MTMRHRGVVRVLKPRFGFIRGDDGLDRFFLPSALQLTSGVRFEQMRELETRVEFTHVDGPKGARAIEVLALDGAPQPELPDEITDDIPF
jgi:cold shock CspA family protein